MAEERLDIVINAIDRATEVINRMNNHLVRFKQASIVQNRHMHLAMKEMAASTKQMASMMEQQLGAAQQKAAQGAISHSNALRGMNLNILSSIDSLRNLIFRITAGYVAFATARITIGGFFNALRSGVQQVEEVEQAVLGMTAALVSLDQRTTAANMPQMFAQTETYVRNLLSSLRVLDIQFSGSLQDLIAMTREFANYGIIVDANNRKQLEALRGIGEAIRALAPGLNFQLQASQLIRAVILGIRDEMDQVTRALGLAGVAGDEFRRRMAEAQTPVERMNIFWDEMSKRVQGFVAMGPRMQMTLEATLSSVQTLWTIISQEAFAGVWKDIVKTLQEWIGLLRTAEGQLSDLGQAIANEIAAQWERVKNAIRDAFGEIGMIDAPALIRKVGDTVVWVVRNVGLLIDVFKSLKSVWDAMPDFAQRWAIYIIVLRTVLGINIVGWLLKVVGALTTKSGAVDILTASVKRLHSAWLGYIGLAGIAVGAIAGITSEAVRLKNAQENAKKALDLGLVSLELAQRAAMGHADAISFVNRALEHHARLTAENTRLQREYDAVLERHRRREREYVPPVTGFRPEPRDRPAGPGPQERAKQEISAIQQIIQAELELGKITVEQAIARLKAVMAANLRKIASARERYQTELQLLMAIQKLEKQAAEESIKAKIEANLKGIRLLEDMKNQVIDIIKAAAKAGDIQTIEFFAKAYKDMIPPHVIQRAKEMVETTRRQNEVFNRAALIIRNLESTWDELNETATGFNPIVEALIKTLRVSLPDAVEIYNFTVQHAAKFGMSFGEALRELQKRADEAGLSILEFIKHLKTPPPLEWIKQLPDEIHEVRSSFDILVDAIQLTFGVGRDKATEAAKAVEEMGRRGISTADALKLYFSGAFEAMKNMVGVLTSSFQNFIADVLKGGGDIKSVWNTVVNYIANQWAKMLMDMLTKQQSFNAAATAAFGGITGAVVGIFALIVNFVIGIFNRGAQEAARRAQEWERKLNELAQRFQDAFRTLFDIETYASAEQAWEAFVKKMHQTLYQYVRDAIIKALLESAMFRAALEPLLKVIEDMMEAIRRRGAGAVNEFRDRLQEALRGIQDLMTTLEPVFRELFRLLQQLFGTSPTPPPPTTTSPSPQPSQPPSSPPPPPPSQPPPYEPPELQRGGLVRRQILALLHPNELVLPLHYLEEKLRRLPVIVPDGNRDIVKKLDRLIYLMERKKVDREAVIRPGLTDVMIEREFALRLGIS